MPQLKVRFVAVTKFQLVPVTVTTDAPNDKVRIFEFVDTIEPHATVLPSVFTDPLVRVQRLLVETLTSNASANLQEPATPSKVTLANVFPAEVMLCSVVDVLTKLTTEVTSFDFV